PRLTLVDSYKHISFPFFPSNRGIRVLCFCYTHEPSGIMQDFFQGRLLVSLFFSCCFGFPTPTQSFFVVVLLGFAAVRANGKKRRFLRSDARGDNCLCTRSCCRLQHGNPWHCRSARPCSPSPWFGSRRRVLFDPLRDLRGFFFHGMYLMQGVM